MSSLLSAVTAVSRRSREEKTFIRLNVDEVVVIVVASHNDKPTCSKPVGYISRGKDGELGRRTNTWISPFYLQHRTYSTEFTSVHGGRPTAEYAKLRRESLETEFGQALGAYSSKSFSAVYRFGPFLALYRAAIISFYVVKLTFWQLFVQDMRKRAVKDQIPPFPNSVAMRCIEEQLGAPVSKLFADISPKPVAAASLGQVYKAHLHSGQLVAVKVQRPGMSLSLTRDALLFHMIGGQLKRFAKARKDLLVAVNEMVRHMFDEIDYVREAKNAERFASLYSFDSANDQVNDNAAPRSMSKNHRAENIKVPKIYWNFTRTAVLTMEWVDGIKLTDEIKLKRASLDRRDLIDQGLSCSLKQLLEVGFFHADPHPGNLVATKEGSLVYFDFGMMGNIPRHYRVGLIQILVHFVNRDSLSLANDFLSLGFLPEGVDIQAVSNALRSSFGSSTRISQDFQGVMEQLYDVMYDFNFSLPPDYALVIRSLGSLEGTAKILDPEFKVIESAYPFVIGRLLADPSPDMRKILRELVICNDGSIRWNRLERLVAAISEQASVTSGDSPEDKTMKKSSELKSFDMHSVVSATEDLLLFILSEKGQRVRVFLLQDIIRVVDIFLEEEVLDLNMKKKQTINLREEGTMKRVSNGFKCLNEAVKLAPGMWTAMLLRMSRKPENEKFSYGYASSAGKRSSMEDFFETRIDGIDGEIVGLFGVFDGHGGAAAAEYLKRHLFSNLITHPNFISDTKSAIADAYNHTDSELLKSENNHTIDAGSTASTAILVRDRLLVANVGDSRAVICRAGTAFAVSRDHKPDQSDERERIENAGGFVMWAGTWRVGGVLAVSRSFGDRLLKEYVIADPEIQEEKIDDSLEFLILASDGLWDVFSNEEAVEVVKEVEDPEESTKKLVGEAIKRGSADNITCVVVRFLESKNANSNADASSSQEIATNGQTVVTSDAEHNVSANETNQDHTAVLSDLDQKPIAVSAAGRSVPSEQNGLAGETNQVPSEIHRGSELKSSSKQPSQGHITVHNYMDESVANQKAVIAEKKAIAATNTTSSEQSGSIGENNQKPTAVHSDSATSKSSNVNSNH
uniref:protein-serine/threonine phosphatase n=1 Tax=Brassica campestris TaxID=3711 RepID=M4D009_BRACM